MVISMLRHVSNAPTTRFRGALRLRPMMLFGSGDNSHRQGPDRKEPAPGQGATVDFVHCGLEEPALDSNLAQDPLARLCRRLVQLKAPCLRVFTMTAKSVLSFAGKV